MIDLIRKVSVEELNKAREKIEVTAEQDMGSAVVLVGVHNKQNVILLSSMESEGNAIIGNSDVIASLLN